MFINLPTGFGESLIFHCLPMATDALFERPHGSSINYNKLTNLLRKKKKGLQSPAAYKRVEGAKNLWVSTK